MENNKKHEGDVSDIINFVKNRRNSITVKTILRAIELCKLEQNDNWGDLISNSYEAVFYKAEQMHLALYVSRG